MEIVKSAWFSMNKTRDRPRGYEFFGAVLELKTVFCAGKFALSPLGGGSVPQAFQAGNSNFFSFLVDALRLQSAFLGHMECAEPFPRHRFLRMTGD